PFVLGCFQGDQPPLSGRLIPTSSHRALSPEMEQHVQFGSFTSPEVARRGARRSPAAWLSVLPCRPQRRGDDRSNRGVVPVPKIVSAGCKPTAIQIAKPSPAAAPHHFGQECFVTRGESRFLPPPPFSAPPLGGLFRRLPPAASSSRRRPSQPRVSPHSRALA